jgi:shikimate dehydrogenase
MTRRLGLIGYPVEHSLSPALQQPALDALGIDARYELWSTPLEELEARVASLREPDAIGGNVTVPHKQAVIPFLDELSKTATRAQAVNTIVNRDGVLVGDNTDVYGLARSLSEAGVGQHEFNALILGAGGAARGALLALESLSVNNVVIANRTVERARDLAASFPDMRVGVTGLDERRLAEYLSASDVIINATSLGWNTGDMPIPNWMLGEVLKESLVVDLTYRETKLLVAASAYGLETLDGLPMLVYQGARSLELWTGRTAPVELMMRHALEARSARS